MPMPLYTNDALDSWKRFGGDPRIVNSYVAATGSSDSLQTPHTNMVASPVAPPAGVKQTATVAPVAEQESVIDYGDANMAEHLAKQKADLDASKPAEVSATYQGPEANSTYWGGALVGGSRTGVEDYGNWQRDRGQYTQALQKWQQQYSDWERGQKMWDDMKARNTPQQPAQPAQPAPQQSPYWGPASTQQQNLGQSPTTQAPSPYAVPGQRSTPLPGTGPVQKPDKSVSKVNERYAGVL